MSQIHCKHIYKDIFGRRPPKKTWDEICVGAELDRSCLRDTCFLTEYSGRETLSNIKQRTSGGSLVIKVCNARSPPSLVQTWIS